MSKQCFADCQTLVARHVKGNDCPQVRFSLSKLEREGCKGVLHNDIRKLLA
jgi:hypothetical protein